MSSALIGDGSVLADLLLTAAGEAAARAGHPVWVLVSGKDEEEAELTFCPDGFDPLGWSAPPDCAALAVVATGRVHPMEESVEMPAGLASARGGGARMACVVSRAGAVGWHMVLPDGSSFDQVPERGLLLDVMGRALGLDTPPPPAPVAVLADYTWLAALLDAPVPRRRLTWSEVLDRHPALGGLDPALTVRAKELYIDWVAGDGSWETVRRAVAGGRGDECFPPAELAAWMDEGMFSRWVLDQLVPMDDLVAQARPRLLPSAARKLAHRVRRGA